MQGPANSAAASQRRLFLASFITLIAAGVGFSIRSGILDDWGRQFGFTQTELGAITGSGLWGFGLAIVFFSLFADRVGYGPLMCSGICSACVVGVATLGATFVFQHHGKDATYWMLYAGMTLFAFANGTCEAVINPLAATLYPKEKTHYLNILHAGWPAGLILGGVFSYLMAERDGQVVVRWEIQWLLFLAPVIPLRTAHARTEVPCLGSQSRGRDVRHHAEGVWPASAAGVAGAARVGGLCRTGHG
jgi:MFS family permease